MHALDWLIKRGRILRGATKSIEGIHFYPSRFRSRYRGLCYHAFTAVAKGLPMSSFIELLNRTKMLSTTQLQLQLKYHVTCTNL